MCNTSRLTLHDAKVLKNPVLFPEIGSYWKEIQTSCDIQTEGQSFLQVIVFFAHTNRCNSDFHSSSYCGSSGTRQSQLVPAKIVMLSVNDHEMRA